MHDGHGGCYLTVYDEEVPKTVLDRSCRRAGSRRSNGNTRTPAITAVVSALHPAAAVAVLANSTHPPHDRF
jgi:hypothetical protein